jgi:hypothetical protein
LKKKKACKIFVSRKDIFVGLTNLMVIIYIYIRGQEICRRMTPNISLSLIYKLALIASLKEREKTYLALKVSYILDFVIEFQFQ